MTEVEALRTEIDELRHQLQLSEEARNAQTYIISVRSIRTENALRELLKELPYNPFVACDTAKMELESTDPLTDRGE